MKILQNLKEIYSFYFVLTIALEFAAYYILSLSLNLKENKFYLFLFIANLLTHPWAYYFVVIKNINVYIIELGVVFFEFLFWLIVVKIKVRDAFIISVFTNLFSYLVGKFMI